MDSAGLIPFGTMTRGAFAGLLRVPEYGYRWDDSLVPSLLGAGAQRDPEDGQLKFKALPYDVANDLGPWLVEPVPMGATRALRQYAPLSVAQLHRRFARLPVTQNDILRFANRYGRLSHGVMLDSANTVFVGESLETWRSEILEMSLLLALWDLVKNEDQQELSTFVRWQTEPRQVSLQLVFGEGRLQKEMTRRMWRDFRNPQEVPFDMAQSSVIAGELVGPDDQALLAKWAYGDNIEPVRYYVHRNTNERMRGHVSPAVLPFRGGDIHFFPDCLLSSLYVHFALEVSGEQRPQIACKGCGEYFRPLNGHQLYCVPRCRKLTYYHRSKAQG